MIIVNRIAQEIILAQIGGRTRFVNIKGVIVYANPVTWRDLLTNIEARKALTAVVSIEILLIGAC